MKKNGNRINRISAVMVALLVLMSISSFAVHESSISNDYSWVPDQTVQNYFELYDRIVDNQGNDITASFRKMFMENDNNADYDVIKAFICENVDYAETQPRKQTRAIATIYRSDMDTLTSTNHNGRFTMNVLYEAELRYQINAAGEFTSASIVSVEVTNSSNIGDLDPEITITNKRATTTSQAATYRFTINIDQVILSSDAVLNPLQGQHVYFKWNVTERLDADEL